MKKSLFSITIFLASLLFTSCTDSNSEQANKYLSHIQDLSNNGNFEEALLKIDSIQVLYPKAFDEIKKGLAYKQEVRRAMNEKQIANCDSLIAIYSPQIDSVKKLFVLNQNKEYQDKGIFVPKTVNSNVLNSNMLRSGVNEDGTVYLESVYLGGQLHDIVRVSSKDKQFAESLPITDDGLNFRFSNLGKQYEVIKVMPVHNNGLIEFISSSSQPLTVTLKGKNTVSYPLSNIQRKAIVDSYTLSKLILTQDSLIDVKEKAQTLINYLDSKGVKNDSIR